MLTNFVIAQIRTYVPIAVGAALAWLASTLHIVIDPASQTGLVVLAVAVLSAAYYALAKVLERWQPWLGVLLGVPAAASYAKLNSAGDYVITDLAPTDRALSGTE